MFVTLNSNTMAYIEQKNPFLDERGYPLPGKSMEAYAFAEAENQRQLDSMSPEDRKRAIRNHRNFVDHMNVAV